MDDPSFLPAWRLAELTRAGEIGCRELLDHFIARVERLNPRINAVVVRDLERARARAHALDHGSRVGASTRNVCCRASVAPGGRP